MLPGQQNQFCSGQHPAGHTVPSHCFLAAILTSFSFIATNGQSAAVAAQYMLSGQQNQFCSGQHPAGPLWLGKTLGGGLLCGNQPGSEFLDTSSVLSPVFDIVGVFVALNLGVGLKVSDILGDPGELILECLGICWDLVPLWEEFSFGCSIGFKDFNLSCNIFLEIHGSCNSIFREHASRGSLDIIKLSSSSLHPAINCLQRVVKACKRSNKLLNFGNGSLEAAKNFEFLLNSLHLLCQDLLLVFRDGDGHAIVIAIVFALLVKILSLLKISIGSFKVEVLLNLLNFFFGNFKFSGDGFIVFSITDECLLSFIQELQSFLCLLLGIIPTFLNTLDIALKELG